MAEINGKKGLIYDSAIAVYDPEKQKLVLLFTGPKAASIYLNGKNDSKNINSYVTKKARLHKNRFNKPLALRYASVSQIELLGENEFLCFDDEFKNDDYKSVYNRQQITKSNAKV